MEEKNKYYTPSIEEFHVGFEYEYFAKPNHNIDSNVPDEEKIWIKTNDLNEFGDIETHGISYIEDYLKRNNCPIRVKHLDKEDILSLGWELIEENEKWIEYKIYVDKDIHKIAPFHLKIYNYIFSPGTIVIYYSATVKFAERFLGIIKNKSELIKIMTMIGIIKLI